MLEGRLLVWECQRCLDSGDMPFGDLGDVLRPVVPVVTLADLVNDACVDEFPPGLDGEQCVLDILSTSHLAILDSRIIVDSAGAVLVADDLIVWTDTADAYLIVRLVLV